MTEANPAQHGRAWKLGLVERRILLILGDFLMAVCALGISWWWWDRSMRFMDLTLDFLQKRGYTWFYLLPFLWMLLLIDIYDIHKIVDWRVTVKGVATAAIIGLFIYAVVYFYFASSPGTFLPRLGVAIFLVAASLLTILWRLIYFRIFSTPEFMRRVLVVGGGNSGKVLIKIVQRISPPPFILVGIIDDDPEKQNIQCEGLPVLGGSENLIRLVCDLHITDVFVAIRGELRSSMFQALLDIQEDGVTISRMPMVYEQLLGRVPIQQLEADWILSSFVDHAQLNSFYLFSKRIFDIIGGLFGTFIFFMVFPFIALAIFLDDKGPIFYTQKRLGKRAHPYSIIKFRTMVINAEENGQPRWATEQDARTTRTGRILRKTHLDELPQFMNVLRGEMSLVGPRAERPELVIYFQNNVPFYRARLLVKPGITGWAQVNFGYASTIDETILKLEYDLYYILHNSLFLDFLILLRTPTTIIGFRGR